MKKYTTLIFILLFMLVNRVKAEVYTCNYSSGDWDDIAITFDLDDKSSPYVIINGNYVANQQAVKIAVVHIGAYWSPMEFKNFLYDPTSSIYYDNVVDYYKASNSCPSDLYLFPNALWIKINDSSSVPVNYIGLLTTGDYDFNIGHYDHVFNIPNVNPETTETDVKKQVCSYQFNIKYRNYDRSYEADVTIIGDEAKATSRTTLIKSTDFSQDCLQTAYACADFERDNLYLAKDKNTMLNNYGDNIFIKTLASLSSYKALPESCDGSDNEEKCFEYLDSYHIYCGEITLGESKDIQIGNGGCTYFSDQQVIINRSDATDSEKYAAFVDLQNFCNIISSKQDYTSNPKSCLYKCMHITDYIQYYPGDTPGECGLSTKITIWIENILRWIKYIVPVLLIVLSILDFIKAIAADKEDEMKKAQKNFKIRLIAAVMIFLLPILIEFVLGKMGFDAENCGIDNIGF